MKASQIPARKPRRVVRLEPADFADTYRGRPKAGVAVGLRLVSDADESAARLQATKEAIGKYAELEEEDAFIEEYNDSLLAQAVAASICDPNDVEKWPESIPAPPDMIRIALLPRAIARLFQEYMMLRSSETPGLPEASDDDIMTLLERLPVLDPPRQAMVRRILYGALELAED